MLLPTAFLPPVSYFSKLITFNEITIEAHEHFVKQTIRNHCEIQSANGRLKLSVPIEHTNRWKIPIEELRIAKGEEWQRKHIRSIRSAYGKSPFYEFYADEFEALLLKDHTRLIELNDALLQHLLRWLRISIRVNHTANYQPDTGNMDDLRSHWNSAAVPGASEKKYTQVFSGKFGFMNDLSIIDLLFNCGPDAVNHL